MLISGWLETADKWLKTNVPGAEWLDLIGAAIVVAGLVYLVWRLFGGLRGTASAIYNASKARRAKFSKTPGFRILLARPAGAGSRRTNKWLSDALSRNLPTFAFDAPFSLVPMGQIKGGLGTDAVALARKRMATADADLFVWASRQGNGERGLEVHGLSRGGGLTPAEARLFTIALPGSRKAQTDDVARLAAYLVAKHLQPALSDPQAFRVEKIRELAGELESVLAHPLPVSSTLLGEIEADFCAAGVRVAEELGELSALDRVIAMRRGHLGAATITADTGRIIQAKLELGRALIVRAEKQFDQAVVKEAIGHLAQAVEGLRTDPTIQRAQAASDALFKAQTMIESRKRFSLNFGS
ncbi:MAG: hypothetical protein FP825_18960 [Hyphomonas sp.]|uniref:hypothetical protein n=1 Tax=Hyphomonas sp. TaxID=87 RepID=UPI00185D743B|nr:hypothetical protein [Hyphomonas sp.]MBA3070544.1 hypothetical protein [Hyphomonas sp.]MBU4062074.1 hypothetical protein [Alphaproteobacteria bacterium]MBU4165010.1 hypothetical protein [Alphaproteobacteria bacterium]MBU4568815.1 hypothetical protein [Alphaproteobacteria bacterium]